MFSNGLIAFLLAAGFSAWVYSKLSRSTGGNASGSLVIAGLSGFLVFLLAFTILGYLF